jgi:hypothetical protein
MAVIHNEVACEWLLGDRVITIAGEKQGTIEVNRIGVASQ